jgi:hypothetical protein
MRGVAQRILARANGRRRASTVTGTVALGSTAAAVVFGIGLAAQTQPSTDSAAGVESSGATAPTRSASDKAGASTAASSRSRLGLSASAVSPRSTTQRAHVRSGGS